MEQRRLRITAHAMIRLAQRNLSVTDLLIAISLGREIYRSSSHYFFVGTKDIPKGSERELGHLVGTTVVVEDNQIITAFRNRNVLSKLKRKAKRYRGHWQNAPTPVPIPTPRIQTAV